MLLRLTNEASRQRAPEAVRPIVSPTCCRLRAVKMRDEERNENRRGKRKMKRGKKRTEARETLERKGCQ